MNSATAQRSGFLSTFFRRPSSEVRQSELVRKKFGDPLDKKQVSFDAETGIFTMYHSKNAGDGKTGDCIVNLDEVVTLLLNRDTNQTDDIGGAITISTDAITPDRVPYNKHHHAIFKVDAMSVVEEFFQASKNADKFTKALSVNNDTFTISF